MRKILENINWLEKKFNKKIILTIYSNGECAIGNPDYHRFLIHSPNSDLLSKELQELVRQIKWLNGSEEMIEN